MQTIGFTSANRHKAFRGFVPEHRYTVHSAEGRKAWELQHYTELEALLLKWQLALAILIKSQVFTDGVYDFFAERKFYKGFDQARLSEILLYLENRYGAFLRKDITQSERDILRSVQKDIYEGAVIGGVRIFPEVYYPYMDKLYFDHANWNRVPKGVGIATEFDENNKYIVLNLDTVEKTNAIINNNGSSCGGSDSGCGCSGSLSMGNMPRNTVLKQLASIHVDTFEEYTKVFRSPYIFISYWILGGLDMPIVDSECFCEVPGVSRPSYCGQPSGNKGGWCGKYPCGSGVSCGCGTKEYPTLC
jgi:hypothetical protein